MMDSNTRTLCSPSLLFALLFFCASSQPKFDEIRNDFKRYYDSCAVQGSFVLYDLNRNHTISYNPRQLDRPYTPASTYKVLHSLVALELNIVRDENDTLRWDGINRQNPAWNKDQDLKTAYKNSTVWYYQELARRIGASREKYWMDSARYGNADTSGGVDRFWLSGGLRVTPNQQIDFLRRLYRNELPFSQRTLDIVKRIMVARETPTYTFRAKTGWGSQAGQEIGWYIGYVEKKDGVYFFANCIQCEDENNPAFIGARAGITNKILTALKVIE